MAEAQCIRYPVRSDRLDALVAWFGRLQERSEELEQVFAEAGVIAEAVFVERDGEDASLLIYSSAEDLRRAMEVLSTSELPLVREFNALLAESVRIEAAVPLELLFDSS